MKETIFKVGDTVYDNSYTEEMGKIIDITGDEDFPITVIFGGEFTGDQRCYTYDGRSVEKSEQILSFTPYKIEVDQKRPEPEITGYIVTISIAETKTALYRLHSMYTNKSESAREALEQFTRTLMVAELKEDQSLLIEAKAIYK